MKIYLPLFFLFIATVLPIGVVVYARLVGRLRLRLRWRIFWGILIFGLMVVLACTMPLMLVLSRYPSIYDSYHVGSWLPWVFYGITFVCMLLFLIFVADVIRFVSHVGRCVKERKKQPKGDVDDELMSRRQFIKQAASGLVAGGAVAMTPAAVYYARSRRVVRDFEIALSSVPVELDGLRIVHLSDIHVGNTIGREEIAHIVEETNALDADLIVITGDMADGMPGRIGEWLEPMRGFRSRYGVYFVTGNHDHMWDGRGWCECVSGLGIHVLDNAHDILMVRGVKIAVAGAIDYRGDRKNRDWVSNPGKALSGIGEGMFKLMLVHQPSSVDACFAGGADLVLLGHTHGGQFWPLTYVIDALHKYSRGLYYEDGGRRAAFVSCGTGYWGPPIRFGVPPEIDVLTLRHAA